MKTSILIRARQHFVNDLAPRHIQRANMRKWVAAIRMLGPKWRMAQPLERPQ